MEVEGLIVISSGGPDDQTWRLCTGEMSEIGFQSWVFSGAENGVGELGELGGEVGLDYGHA